jgi:hypothetical protein
LKECFIGSMKTCQRTGPLLLSYRSTFRSCRTVIRTTETKSWASELCEQMKCSCVLVKLFIVAWSISPSSTSSFPHFICFVSSLHFGIVNENIHFWFSDSTCINEWKTWIYIIYAEPRRELDFCSWMTMCSSATYEVKIFSSVVLGPYSTRAPKCRTYDRGIKFFINNQFCDLIFR